jgi:hypothetical protein
MRQSIDHPFRGFTTFGQRSAKQLTKFVAGERRSDRSIGNGV